MDVKELQKQFTYFYKKVFKKEYLFSSNDLKVSGNFCKLLKSEYSDSISKDWLFNYLLFQFGRFDYLETNMSVRLNWIYGKKALTNYKNRHESADYFSKGFRKNHNIRRGELLGRVRVSLSNNYKDSERGRFKGDNIRQFLHCHELGLFDPGSSICRMCLMKIKCAGQNPDK